LKPLLAGYGASLVQLARPDVALWAEIYKFLGVNVTHVDRVGDFHIPFDFRLYEPLRLPLDLAGFADSYEDCCARRAAEIARLQEKKQVPIALLYSGGIDSTLALVSFAKELGAQLKDRLTVYLSPESIRENPAFYYSFIRKRCRMESSEHFDDLFDGSCLVVTGEHNDQLFGSDIVGRLSRYQAFDKVSEAYSRGNIVQCFRHAGMSDAAANAWFDALDASARRAPCAVKTVFEFFWWFAFVFKWQCVYFRTPLRVHRAQQRNVTAAFLDTYYHTFYGTREFQKWSMANPQLKVQETWRTYKFPAKQLIYEFNRDEDYFRYKVKTGSLGGLFMQKQAPLALTTDFEFVYDLAPEALYLEDNSFRRTASASTGRASARRAAAGPTRHPASAASAR